MIISFIRTILLYIFIILAVRLMGKRQISELQTSELVVTLLISDIAAIPMQNSGLPLLSGLIPIMVLVACEILISVIMLKSTKFRRFICGNPVILINNGKLDQKQMKNLRMSIEDLEEELRQMDVSSVSDIAFAIVETNGKISIIKKPEKQQPDTSMLNIQAPDNGIETVVVRDGELSDFCIKLCGLTKEWIYGVLKKQNVNIKEVFIMTANKNKDFNIIKKEV
ncbi:MAG: hypothetical protein RUMPE_01098 [Eubacteriales bacterium SKADARSKE-1]|nr:hypothetical protein [Eubacteriales bacterium SKADARSKE-1]